MSFFGSEGLVDLCWRLYICVRFGLGRVILKLFGGDLLDLGFGLDFGHRSKFSLLWRQRDLRQRLVSAVSL